VSANGKCSTHAASRELRADGIVYCLGCGEALPRIYPDRLAFWHRNMGPPEYYKGCCGGTGKGYDEEGREVFCRGPGKTGCDAGDERRRLEARATDQERGIPSAVRAGTAGTL
jgi:hypothetical protein